MEPNREALWKFWMNPMSAINPGDGDGVLILGGIFSSTWWSARRGARDSVGNESRRRRRYQDVPAKTVAAHVVLSVLIGYGVTILAAPLLLPHRGRAAGAAALDDEGTNGAVAVAVDARTLLTGIATVTFHAILDWSLPSRELSPRQFWTVRGVESVLDSMPQRFRTATLVALGSTVLSNVITHWFADETAKEWRWWDLVSPLNLFFFSLVVGMYVLVLDGAVKITLFDRCRIGTVASGDEGDASEGPLDELIEELNACSNSIPSDARNDEIGLSIASLKLEILLTGLLYSRELVREIVASVPSSPAAGMAGTGTELGRREREEERRVVEAALRLGHQLVHPLPAGAYPEAPLEEDVLRVSILQALAEGVVTEFWLGGSAGRIEWAVGENPLHGMYPMYILPLVRALCVHIRGMGDALLTCASPLNRGTPFLGSSGVSLQRWHLPPGFAFAVECSIKALSTLLAQCNTEQDEFVSWKRYMLSAFVPISLSSMFHLRRGLLAFETPPPIQISGEPSFVGEVTGESFSQRQLEMSLMQSCDKGALSVVLSIHLPQGHPGFGRSGVRDEECLLWVNGLLAAQEKLTVRSNGI
jgi:hypothetical protein